MKTTLTEGALINLTRTMTEYKIQVLVVQETRQIGNEITEVGDCIMFNSGGQDRSNYYRC